MSNASDYLEVSIGNHLLRSATFAKPAGIWLALLTAAPDDAGGGTEVDTSGTGYARVLAGPDDANWSEPTDSGAFVNLVQFVFGEPTGDWGSLITHWALFDAETGGNLLIHAPLIVPQSVANGGLAPKFAAGDLQITIA